MGIFKEASDFGEDTVFEQLFKHEGYCVWNDDDLYEFMDEAREESWPQGCVSTGIQGTDVEQGNGDDDGNNGYIDIYIDVKPSRNGNMTLGLYIDQACKTEYSGFDIDASGVAKNLGLIYGDDLRKWNDALEVYKYCQPCRSYNLANDYVMGYEDDDDDDGEEEEEEEENNDDERRRHLEGDYSYEDDVNEGYFLCNDNAGYTNVNQCMKFKTHANLEVASWEDLVEATNQGGMLEVKLGDVVFGNERLSAEQNEYMNKITGVYMPASEAREEAKKAAAKLKYVQAEAVIWENLGNVTFAIGLVLVALSLLLVGYRKSRNASKQKQQTILANPLLE